MAVEELTSNQVILCLLALWSVGFWVAGGWQTTKGGKEMIELNLWQFALVCAVSGFIGALTNDLLRYFEKIHNNK